jgi:hypothetical protein
MRRTDRLALRCAVLLLCLGATACGGSSKTTTKTNPPTTPGTHTPTITAASSAVTTSGIHATLHAPNHAPVVNKPWPYTVIVMDASARPLAGTVTIQFALGSQIVGRDTPPTHRLKKGRWHDVLRFPARAVGIPLTFQTVVRTPAGSVTLNWPVKVKP